jgi:hypothetical protein
MQLSVKKTMLFQVFRPQFQRERPTITSTARRESKNGQLDIGGNMRLEGVRGVSSRSAVPVIIVMQRPAPTKRPDGRSPALGDSIEPRWTADRRRHCC